MLERFKSQQLSATKFGWVASQNGIVAACVVLTSVFAALVTYGLYTRGFYGFHDAGLINDWFSNALSGRPFYISEYGWNHLGKHFTPSLLLLIPFYILTDSQYVLLLIGSLCMGWTFWEIYQFTQAYAGWRFSKKLPVSNLFWPLLFLVTLLTHNSYLKSVLLCGHFEILFIPLALRTLRSFMLRQKAVVYYSLLIIAAGIRQDAGIFLASLLLGFSIHGRNRLTPYQPRRLFISMAALAFYCVVVIKFIMPVFGSDQNVSLWNSWGSSYVEIGSNMLNNPSRLLNTIQSSGFIPLLGSFFYLPLLTDPLGFIVSHAPSWLLYTMDHNERRMLYWYNSAFLLPSCIIFGLIAFVRIISWLRIARSKTACILLSVGFLYLLSREISKTAPVDTLPTYSFQWDEMRHKSQRASAVRTLLRSCKRGAKVASDFYIFTYLPLRFERYLLDRWADADILIFDPSYNPGLPFMVDPGQLAKKLNSPAFYQLGNVSQLNVYVAKDSKACQKLALTAGSQKILNH